MEQLIKEIKDFHIKTKCDKCGGTKFQSRIHYVIHVDLHHETIETLSQATLDLPMYCTSCGHALYPNVVGEEE